MNMIGTFIKPMHPEGRKFVAIFAAVTVGLFVLTPILGWVGVGLTVWCYYFFRDPERVTPHRPGLVISPADGIVSLIELSCAPGRTGAAGHATDKSQRVHERVQLPHQPRAGGW